MTKRHKDENKKKVKESELPKDKKTKIQEYKKTNR